MFRAPFVIIGAGGGHVAAAVGVDDDDGAHGLPSGGSAPVRSTIRR
jgi:hypothetical protein